MDDLDLPLTTDAAVLAAMQHLVGEALRRQLWLFFLDHDQRLHPVAGPMEGVPVDPDPQDVALLARRLTEATDGTGASAAVLVWERPGDATLRMQEADWVAGLAASGAPIRLQLLASDAGVRIIDPAFEAIVAA